jgi:tricorn protease
VIAYENEFDIWTLDVPGGTPRRVELSLAFDPRQNLVDYVTTRNRANSFSPSPEGDYLAVEHRGEIFIVPTEQGIGEKRQVTSSPWRDQRQRFSPDGRYVAYLSDESREQELWVHDREKDTRRKLTSHRSFKDDYVWAPDSSRLAYVASNHLFVVDVETAKNVEVSHNEAGGYQLSQFSPDGKWIIYTRRDEDMNSEVYAPRSRQARNTTLHENPFANRNGVLTPDGSRLVFISDRDNGVAHLFVVPLERQVEDPDDPLVKERLRKAKPEKKDEKAQPPPFKVDPEGIARRAVQITRGEQAVAAFFLSADGKLVYFVSTDERGRGLFSVGIDGADRKRVSEGAFAGLTPSGDRKKVFYTQDGDIYQMELSGERKKTKIEFTFTVKVDYRAEWLQIFDECWRVMKYRFYDAKMHGRDWKAIKAAYEPLLAYVGENQDVYDLSNMMIGELNASHTGVSGPPTREMPALYRSRTSASRWSRTAGATASRTSTAMVLPTKNGSA